MKERSCDVSSHSLPERELTCREVEKVAEAERFGKAAHIFLEPRPPDTIDGPQKGKGLGDWNVPPQLGPLPKHRPYIPTIVDPLAMGDQPIYGYMARGRDQDAGKHFYCG
jgi:hypothetical protein